VMRLKSDTALANKLGARGLAYRREVLGADAAIDRYAEWLVSLAKMRGRLGRVSRSMIIGDR